MQHRIFEEDGMINSIIGEGTRFEGDLHLEGLLRIDGDFKGSIVTNGTVYVSKNGRADCTIDARRVVVGGLVQAHVRASEQIILLSTAVVIGTIDGPRLTVEEGVMFNGLCRAFNPQHRRKALTDQTVVAS
jgi:cytoskeletal protein CcmA (bactofilin family)